MLGQLIADIIIERETARIDEVMHETSPAEVLRRLEREQADYLSYVAGTTDRGTYRALLDAVARATTWAPILALALLVGCDATGLTVEQTADTPADVPQSIAPQPAPVVPPPAPVPPPVAVPAPLPVPVPPQAAPVQPPLAPGAPLPAPTPPPPIPPCFDRDLGVISPCAGRLDCTVSSTVTERTMCQAAGVTYVATCETCAGVW